jgi:hypothetical protein
MADTPYFMTGALGASAPGRRRLVDRGDVPVVSTV